MYFLMQAPRLASRAICRTNRVLTTRPVISAQLGTNAITRRWSSTSASQDDDTTSIRVTFVFQDKSKVSVKTSPGKSLYDAVIDNNVDIDGFGACGGTLCCTTCHLIPSESDYKKVGPPSEEEMDMLELAYGLDDCSRLGCQVILKKEHDPLEVQVPESNFDARES